MKSATLSFVLLAAATPVAAQAVITDGQQSSGIAGTAQTGNGAQQPKLTQEQLQQRVEQMKKALTARLAACPISMDVSQGGGLHILRAKKDGTVSQPGMTPTLSLRAPGGKHIASANITAYGYSAPNGTTLLQAGTDKPADLGNSLKLTPTDRAHPAQRRLLTRTMTIQFETDNSGDDNSEFHLPDFVTLTSIRLNAVTYDDGSIWNVAASNSCRVAPSPLMYVSAASVSPAR